LENISYYRLGGYWYTLQTDVRKHTFRPGTSFEQVITFYNFDREVRLLLFDAIERVEIGFRTRMVYHLSHEYNPWWFEDETLFKNVQVHESLLKDIYKDLGRTEEDFIREHKRKYKTPSTPPSWKTLEIVSLGVLSKLYATLKSSPVKQTIAKSLHLPNNEYLEAWMNSLVVLRNLCAHHARIFNRLFSFPPKILKTTPDPWVDPPKLWQDSQKLYYQICFVLFLLNVVSPGSSFKQQVFDLIDQYSTVSLTELGFPKNWKNEPLWQ
ncbi:MAG TPA: Abi family protein, partial [Flavisolibacter sp.]